MLAILPAFESFGVTVPISVDPALASESKDSPDLALLQWDLSDLYLSLADPSIDADLKRAEELVGEFVSSFAGKIDASCSAEILSIAVRRYEELRELLSKLMSYAGLVRAKNASDPEIQKFASDTFERVTKFATELVFFELSIQRLEEVQVNDALSDNALARYRPWFRTVRALAPFQLSNELEQLLVEKQTTSRASWIRLFDETVARMRVHLEGKDATLESALQALSDSEPQKRKTAGEALAASFESNISVFSLALNTLVKDKAINDDWRKFPDPATSRHLANDIEPEVVAALSGAVQNAYPRLSHRYYALKAKIMGVEQLNYWDRNAPLYAENERPIDWAEAVDIVLAAYASFSPSFAAIAKQFFDKNWIDAPVLPGKTSGAFSHPTVPSVHPYILVNFAGKRRNVMTLAHELGHGVHQVLAAEQGHFLSQTPLTLAETASVFGEMLTFQSLLKQCETRTERQSLLSSKIEDMLNTVVRQIAFYEFETRIHAARREGELTPDHIGKLWLEVQKESLGPAIRLNPGYETYWCYISHFIHAPFYVYAYAFGDCLVNTLYQNYLSAPEGFVDRYVDMLKAGGSLHHSELLAPLGLDASDPQFWAQGLKVIESLIDEFGSNE